MNGKERFDALLAISKAHRERFEKRRSYEWKIFLALWSGLGLLAIGLSRASVTFGTPSLYWLVPLSVAIFVAVFGFTLQVSKRHQQDSGLARHYLDLATCSIVPEPIPIAPPKLKVTGKYGVKAPCAGIKQQPMPRAWWSHILQWVVTGALLLFVCLVALSRSEDSSKRPQQVIVTTTRPLEISPGKQTGNAATKDDRAPPGPGKQE